MASLALSELIIYMTDTKRSGEGPAVFRLQTLFICIPSAWNSWVWSHLLLEMPRLEAHMHGREVMLAFQKDASFALSKASDYNSEAIILGEAAKI